MRLFRPVSRPQVPLVVATDVAARGLDIRNVEYVVNFDMPTNIENYIHRIGRTGRAGSHGKSISFFCDDDESLAHDLVQVLEEAGQKIEPKLWEYAHRARAKLASKEGRDSLFTKRKNRFSQRVEPYNAQMVSKIASGTLERPAAKAVRSSIGQVRRGQRGRWVGGGGIPGRSPGTSGPLLVPCSSLGRRGHPSAWDALVL